MKKVHITLVGGQPAPIYHGIVAIQPDKIIYIYSELSKNTLNVLKENIDIDSEDIMLDVTSPDQIKFCAEGLRDIYKNFNVTINITSGLKSWSHWFGVTFHNETNATVIYIDQNNVLWDYKTMETFKDISFDMRTIFKLYGNELINYTQFSDYTKQDFDVINKIEKIRKYHPRIFKSLTIDLNNENKHNLNYGKETLIESKLRNDLSCVRYFKELCRIEFDIFSKRNCHKYAIESPHIKDIVFNAGWFELKVAKLLSKWDKAKEICMNCRFTYQKDEINEVDIIVDTGSKILFVECKTQITKVTDIEKFRSVIKGYGGTSSKGLFITDSPMKANAKALCEKHGILTFSIQDEHFDLNVDTALYRLLDNELYNINTK